MRMNGKIAGLVLGLSLWSVIGFSSGGEIFTFDAAPLVARLNSCSRNIADIDALATWLSQELELDPARQEDFNRVTSEGRQRRMTKLERARRQVEILNRFSGAKGSVLAPSSSTNLDDAISEIIQDGKPGDEEVLFWFDKNAIALTPLHNRAGFLKKVEESADPSWLHERLSSRLMGELNVNRIIEFSDGIFTPNMRLFRIERLNTPPLFLYYFRNHEMSVVGRFN
jgi:hypothetical protein